MARSLSFFKKSNKSREGTHFSSWLKEGGPGSGNFGHSGRPGEIGGSGAGDGDISDSKSSDTSKSDGPVTSRVKSQIDKIKKTYAAGEGKTLDFTDAISKSKQIYGASDPQFEQAQGAYIDAKSEMEGSLDSLHRSVFGKKGPKNEDEFHAVNAILKAKSELTGEDYGQLPDTWLAKIKMKTKGESIATSSANFRESSRPISIGERKASVIIITEGLGNLVNKNYYGPEAIQSAVSVFEGASAYLDHPSEFDEKNRPERSVKDKCGYYTNVRAESVGGKLSLLGDLHFDDSESGRMAYAKCKAAVKFAKENPKSDRVYIGLSVCANGASERRTMKVGEAELDVNYVTEFISDGTESADLVTIPARGGKILACESMAGRKQKSTEEQMKEAIKLIAAALSEAVTKHKSLEAAKPELDKVAAMLKEAEEKCGEDEAEESEAEEADEKYSKLKAEHEALMKKHEDIGKMVKDLHKALHGEDPAAGAEDESEAEESEAEGEAVGKKKAVDMPMEARRKLVGYALKEANVPADVVDMGLLLKKAHNVKALEAEIKRTASILKISTGAHNKLNESGEPTDVVKIGKDACQKF